jgi:hypothetical protein
VPGGRLRPVRGRRSIGDGYKDSSRPRNAATSDRIQRLGGATTGNRRREAERRQEIEKPSARSHVLARQRNLIAAVGREVRGPGAQCRGAAAGCVGPLGGLPSAAPTPSINLSRRKSGTEKRCPRPAKTPDSARLFIQHLNSAHAFAHSFLRAS